MFLFTEKIIVHRQLMLVFCIALFISNTLFTLGILYFFKDLNSLAKFMGIRTDIFSTFLF